MIFFIRRAIQDILTNRFIHAVTIITIALSVLIVSSFGLFFINTKDIMDSWRKGVRIMAYLKKDFQPSQVTAITNQIKQIGDIQSVVFISKEDAFRKLKSQMGRQKSLLENLDSNPLPDAIEIKVSDKLQDWEKIEQVAVRVEAIKAVDEVEYGQKWLGRLTSLFKLFSLAGSAMCGVFFMASVFIVANTIRLLFYSRHEEFEIMRLVGATDIFIKTPFYIEGLLQGAIGGIIGIFILFGAFAVIVSNIEGLSYYLIDIKFLPFKVLIAIILCSMFAGWLGCYLSFKQFLNKA